VIIDQIESISLFDRFYRISLSLGLQVMEQLEVPDAICGNAEIPHQLGLNLLCQSQQSFMSALYDAGHLRGGPNSLYANGFSAIFFLLRIIFNLKSP
jgi:hypothetical protein